MNIKNIRMMVKRVQYQEVVISEDNGYEMPQTGKALISMAEDLKANPTGFCRDDSWRDDEVIIDTFAVDE
jgi:hypothetical protein